MKYAIHNVIINIYNNIKDWFQRLMITLLDLKIFTMNII